MKSGNDICCKGRAASGKDDSHLFKSLPKSLHPSGLTAHPGMTLQGKEVREERTGIHSFSLGPQGLTELLSFKGLDLERVCDGLYSEMPVYSGHLGQ